MELVGILHFHSETGTEGGYWAFQDSQFITINTTRFSCVKCHKCWDKEKYPEGPIPRSSDAIYMDRSIPLDQATGLNFELPSECPPDQHDFQPISKESWSYEGLQILENGDRLTIYSKDGPRKVLWSGKISLLNYPLFTLSVFGMWAHSEPTHVFSPAQLKLKRELISNLSITCEKLWNAQYPKTETKNKDESADHKINFLSSDKAKLIKKLSGLGLRKREKWAKWFFKGYPAKLIKVGPPKLP